MSDDRRDIGHAPGETAARVLAPATILVLDDAPTSTTLPDAPNVGALERRLARLEGTESALVLSSGMAAISCTLLALLRPGDHLVASNWLSNSTRHFFQTELPSVGVEVSFVDPTSARGWRRAMRKNTRVIFLESLVDATTRVVDMKPVAMLALEIGVALVVDATATTPINFRAREHGADVIIHAATAYLSGDGDVSGGVVAGADAVVDEVRAKMQQWGQTPSPFALWLLARGLRSLDVRMQRHNESAMRIARWAEQHASITAVQYPGLASHPDHTVAASLFDAFSGVLILVLAGGAPSAHHLVHGVQLFTPSAAVGGMQSRIHIFDDGVNSGVRLSIGLEDVGDLIADLTQALT